MNTPFTDALSFHAEPLRRGVHLERRGDKIACLPKGAAGTLLSEVARFKSALLELLEAPAHIEMTKASAQPIALCNRLTPPRLPDWLGAPELAQIAQRFTHAQNNLWRSMNPQERLVYCVVLAYLDHGVDVPRDWENAHLN